MEFDWTENIFPQVREHHETMHGGPRFFWRGKLEWTLQVTPLEGGY